MASIVPSSSQTQLWNEWDLPQPLPLNDQSIPMYLNHPHFKLSSHERVLVAPQGERKASAAPPLKPMLLACPILPELHPADPGAGGEM